MAGLGRRTHYRKHLTDAVLYETPEPQADERIAKVVASRGSNQFDILIATDDNKLEESVLDSRTPQLAILPTKFRKLVWVKRNDYLIVQTGADDLKEEETGSIRYVISHILYKDQIQHLVSRNLWPVHDAQFALENMKGVNDGDDEEEVADDDGIVYDNHYGDDEYDEDASDNDDDLFVNTNRVAKLTIQDSSDSDDDDDD
jgi:probable RNA-binding protein EIF1AD